jgi:hypothetical protein
LIEPFLDFDRAVLPSVFGFDRAGKYKPYIFYITYVFVVGSGKSKKSGSGFGIGKMDGRDFSG